jgi:hypothetical protein
MEVFEEHIQTYKRRGDKGLKFLYVELRAVHGSVTRAENNK